jgi:hypothetical protein
MRALRSTVESYFATPEGAAAQASLIDVMRESAKTGDSAQLAKAVREAIEPLAKPLRGDR